MFRAGCDKGGTTWPGLSLLGKLTGEVSQFSKRKGPCILGDPIHLYPHFVEAICCKNKEFTFLLHHAQ